MLVVIPAADVPEREKTNLYIRLLNSASGPGPGFPDGFWAGLGSKCGSNGLKSGPKVPGPLARTVWDRISIRSN